jgi:hypothetical protein
VIGVPQALILIGMKLKGMDGFAWERRVSTERDWANGCKAVDGKITAAPGTAPAWIHP